MTQAVLTVIRHGESNWNAEGRQQGHLDSGLSSRGRRQAEAMAKALRDGRFDANYSSDLGRAQQTADIIAEALGMHVVTDPRLRERHLGIFQGHTWPEAEREYPEEVARFRTGDPDYIIPSGESARQRFERTVGALEDIALRHLGESVLVVAHGGVLDGLFRRTLGIPLNAPRRFRLWNAGMNVFYYDESGHWTLGTWGDVSHLAEMGTLDDA